MDNPCNVCAMNGNYCTHYKKCKRFRAWVHSKYISRDKIIENVERDYAEKHEAEIKKKKIQRVYSMDAR